MHKSPSRFVILGMIKVTSMSDFTLTGIDNVRDGLRWLSEKLPIGNRTNFGFVSVRYSSEKKILREFDFELYNFTKNDGQWNIYRMSQSYQANIFYKRIISFTLWFKSIEIWTVFRDSFKILVLKCRISLKQSILKLMCCFNGHNLQIRGLKICILITKMFYMK